MFYVTNFASVSLRLSLLAKCKTSDVLYVGKGKYLSSTVNAIVLLQNMYKTLELPYVTDTKTYLFLSAQLKCEFIYTEIYAQIC